MNRTVRRTLVAGALALPLTLGAAGIASADTYAASTATAGPAGASHSSIYSSTGSNPHYAGGSATYYRENASATEDGASSDYTYAAADSRGGVRYAHGENTAGPEGATSSHVSASAGGEHRNHHHHSPGLRGGRER